MYTGKYIYIYIYMYIFTPSSRNGFTTTSSVGLVFNRTSTSSDQWPSRSDTALLDTRRAGSSSSVMVTTAVVKKTGQAFCEGASN